MPRRGMLRRLVGSENRCVSSFLFFFFSSRRRHTRCLSDWSSDVCSSDLRPWRPDAGYPHRVIGEIRRLGARAGVSVNPGTPLGTIDDLLSEVDQVMLMADRKSVV